VDPDDIARKIGPRTRALLPVDQLGVPCDIDRILALADAHGLLVIQDAACAFGSSAHGRPVGSFAPITIFSLHARKVVTTGEGGMMVTDDAALADRLRRLRHQGMSLSDFERHDGNPTNFESYPEIGYNFRLTDIQASIGLCQLARLDSLLSRRRQIAERYLIGLANDAFIAPPHVPESLVPNWQSFQVRVRPSGPLTRNCVMEALHAQGVATRRGVMASHLEKPYRGFDARLPHTERAAAECMQLPMHSGMTDAEADQVLEALDRVFRQHRLARQHISRGAAKRPNGAPA
jgi:perosamine synthetase